MTSFNDKAVDELFMVLLSVCVCFCVGALCELGVNNSEKKAVCFLRDVGMCVWGGGGTAKAKTHLKHMGGNHIESSEQ